MKIKLFIILFIFLSFFITLIYSNNIFFNNKRMKMASTIRSIEKVNFPFSPPSPFLFCAYHKDFYPPAKDGFNAPRIGNGMDFNPSQPYRMYHGTKIPGFPQHPHRGFETLTCTLKGYVDHFDSKGFRGRYGEGDLQWMTAGSGVCHSEMFPLIKENDDNTLVLFQLWLNLPKKLKGVDPTAGMIWANEMPFYEGDNSSVRLWVGDLSFKTSHTEQCEAADPIHLHINSPVPNSYANDPANDVTVAYIKIKKNSSVILEPAPHATNSSDINRILILIEGNGGVVDEREFKNNYAITVDASKSVKLFNPFDEDLEILLMQGRPINEPVAQHGPFVMNTREEIIMAYDEYVS